METFLRSHWTLFLMFHRPELNLMAITSAASEAEKYSHLAGWLVYSPKTWCSVNKEEWESRKQLVVSVVVMNLLS